MAIKVGLGKLTLSEPFETLIPEQLSINGIQILDINVSHAAKIINLPFHHRDPFDRLLIAQALTEEIPIISSDEVFDDYGVTRLW
jgi:PIN domain nuclease of toxin-antitoxin system